MDEPISRRGPGLVRRRAGRARPGAARCLRAAGMIPAPRGLAGLPRAARPCGSERSPWPRRSSSSSPSTGTISAASPSSAWSRRRSSPACSPAGGSTSTRLAGKAVLLLLSLLDRRPARADRPDLPDRRRHLRAVRLVGGPDPALGAGRPLQPACGWSGSPSSTSPPFSISSSRWDERGPALGACSASTASRWSPGKRRTAPGWHGFATAGRRGWSRSPAGSMATALVVWAIMDGGRLGAARAARPISPGSAAFYFWYRRRASRSVHAGRRPAQPDRRRRRPSCRSHARRRRRAASCSSAWW